MNHQGEGGVSALSEDATMLLSSGLWFIGKLIHFKYFDHIHHLIDSLGREKQVLHQDRLCVMVMSVTPEEPVPFHTTWGTLQRGFYTDSTTFLSGYIQKVVDERRTNQPFSSNTIKRRGATWPASNQLSTKNWRMWLQSLRKEMWREKSKPKWGTLIVLSVSLRKSIFVQIKAAQMEQWI